MKLNGVISFMPKSRWTSLMIFRSLVVVQDQFIFSGKSEKYIDMSDKSEILNF